MRILSIFLLACLFFGCATNKKEAGSKELENRSAEEMMEETEGLDVEKYVLDNGLTVLLVENGHLPIFSYYTFYKVGAKFEPKGLTGSSHLLEHLLFKGTKNFGPGIFDGTIEKNGGSTNAYTNMDNTVYYENLPSVMLQKIIQMESDRMQNLVIDPVAFEKERKVVLEERKMRYENSPKGQLFLAMMQEVFKDTPYGGSVIGHVPDLETVTHQQVMEYYKKYYAPNNAVVVIVGGIDQDDTIDWIKQSFGKIPPSSSIEELKKVSENSELFKHHNNYGRVVNLNGSSPTPIFSIAYKAEPYGSRKAYVADILSQILGSGDSSYLVQKYVKGSRPLLNSIYAANYNLNNNGIFFIGGQLLGSTNLPKFRRTIQRDLKSVCKTLIDERSIQKTKNQFWIDYYNGLNSNQGIAHYLGLKEAFFGNYEKYKEEMEIYQSIGKDEVTELCHEVFDKGENIFLSVWDKHKKKK